MVSRGGRLHCPVRYNVEYYDCSSTPGGLGLVSRHSDISDIATRLKERQHLLCCQLEGEVREGKRGRGSEGGG